MGRCVLGFILIDTPHSALNNAGTDAGERTENKMIVKTIRRGRSIYPYVSAQALRYWWRSCLGERYNWKLSPIIREAKIAFTEANPILYDDDDVFGYMRAVKKEKPYPDKTKKGTLTRVSPLKCSPLLSVLDHKPTNDFGVMSRQEGDPVPYEHEFYSTIMKGIFSLDLEAVGAFSVENRTGYKNLDENLLEFAKKAGAAQEDGLWILPKDIRLRRVQNTIEALAYLYGGAKHTLHLTDVTPRFLILTVFKGGNHIFMNAATEVNGEVTLCFPTLREVLRDYQGDFLSPVYIGRASGFLDNQQGGLSELAQIDRPTVKLFTPKQAIETFVKELENHVR